MTLRQKSNPIPRNPVNEKISGKLDPNSGILPKSQDNSAGSSESFINEDTLLGNNSLAVEMNRRNLQHRTCLNPSDVQYWVTNSSSHLDTVLDSNPCSQTSYGSDLSSSIVAPNIPGPVSVSQSNFSHISLQCSAQIPGAQGMNLNYDDISESVVASQMNTALGISNTFSLDENMNILGEQYQSDTWSYPTPGDDDINFANSMATHSMMVSNEQDVCPQWSSEPFEPGAEISDGSIPCTSQSIDWSPIMAVDPSISSSYSQSSLLTYQPNTPLSPCTQEDSWYHGPCGTLDVESGLCSTFSLGEPVQFSPSPEFVDNQSTSTLKPIQVFQRTPVSAVDCWSQDEVAKQGYMAPYPVRRKSSEGETTTAREHPYYHVGPGKDNLYHCPFAGDEDCNHKPEKLKCNYDKHLDSHLKPYRCKVPSCVAVPFSSTACLLRHEREAHGMHGHGEKPHLCHFVDCDRSQPGNGFPRRWNLGDHMKRVHEYTGPAYSAGSSSPTPSSDSSYQGVPSKRRTSNSSHAEGPKRAKPATSTKSAQKASRTIAPSTTQGKHRQSMDKMWHEKMAAIKAGLEALDPNDARASDRINADYVVLQTIGQTIRRHEANQLVN